MNFVYTFTAGDLAQMVVQSALLYIVARRMWQHDLMWSDYKRRYKIDEKVEQNG